MRFDHSVFLHVFIFISLKFVIYRYTFVWLVLTGKSTAENTTNINLILLTYIFIKMLHEK